MSSAPASSTNAPSRPAEIRWMFPIWLPSPPPIRPQRSLFMSHRSHRLPRGSDVGQANPAAFAVRSQDGGDDPADLETVGEGWKNRLSRLDCFQKVAHLDDDLVVVAGSVAGSQTEGLVIGMLGPGQKLREPAAADFRLGIVEPQRVLVLLVETQRAGRARDLVGITHLTAVRDAADHQRAHGAVNKAAQQMRLIVVADPFALAH